MVNLAVDHLLALIFLGMIALFVPIPLSFLAIIVIVGPDARLLPA